MPSKALKVSIFDKPEGAPQYVRGTRTLEIKEAIVVRRSTVRGKATLDLIMVDTNGNEYVALVTAEALEMAAAIAKKA